jgi:hypothetical protein
VEIFSSHHGDITINIRDGSSRTIFLNKTPFQSKLFEMGLSDTAVNGCIQGWLGGKGCPETGQEVQFYRWTPNFFQYVSYEESQK